MQVARRVSIDENGMPEIYPKGVETRKLKSNRELVLLDPIFREQTCKGREGGEG